MFPLHTTGSPTTTCRTLKFILKQTNLHLICGPIRINLASTRSAFARLTKTHQCRTRKDMMDYRPEDTRLQRLSRVFSCSTPAFSLLCSLFITNLKFDILNPRTCKIPLPSPTDPALPDLKLYRGYKCSRCPYILSKTKTGHGTMEQHFNQHRVLPRKQGGPRKVPDIPEEDQGPMFTEVYCQRVFAACRQSSFVVVYVPSEVGNLKAKPHTSK